MPEGLLVRLAGRPLAIAPRALDGFLAASVSPNARSDGMPVLRDVKQAALRGYTVAETGIAVVPVLGPLMTRGDWMTALFGGTSYGEIASTVEAALAEPSVRGVLLEVDSPGGEVGGLFDLVDRLVALRDAAQKPLWAVASECALSAAYAIASVADRIYVTRTAEVGSIGVVAIHIDESGGDAMAGLKWTLVHAGARKVDGNPHEPLSARAFADIQADVDALHADLITLVARNRKMAPDAVRATEAAIYRSQRGVDAGLADRVGTVEQALADLAGVLQPPRLRTGPAGHARALQSPRSTIDMTIDTSADPATTESAVDQTTAPAPDPAEAPCLAPPAPPPLPLASSTQEAAGRLRAEYAEIAAIAAQASRLSVTIDAAEAMAKGIAPHALRRSVLDTLAARSDATAVVVAASPPAAAGDSPIVRRARERAAAARS